MWAIAIVVGLAAAVWALSAVFNTDVPPSEAFYDFNAARVEQFASRTEAGALGVVMLGDSRMRYGTETDDVLSAALTQQLGTEVAVLRLVNNWAVFEDFEPLTPIIADANPSLVVIQNELRVKNRASTAGSLIKREYLKWRIFGSGPWNPGDLDQTYLQFEMRCEVLLDEDVEARRERVFRWVDFDEAGPNATKVAAFVADLERSSAAVRYLTVPITSAGQTGLPGIEPVAAPDGLGPDFEITDDHFCDIVHMNPEGRELYTDWFVGAVSDELRSYAALDSER